MEGRLSALEKWVSGQGRVIVELKTDMGMVKEGLLELKKIKEMLKASKKVDKSSKNGKMFINDKERREISVEIGNNFEEDEEERAKTWTRMVELPVFQSMDP